MKLIQQVQQSFTGTNKGDLKKSAQFLLNASEEISEFLLQGVGISYLLIFILGKSTDKMKFSMGPFI